MGDIDHVVSVTSKGGPQDISLVSFKRGPLEEYLAASASILIRRFDFTLLNYQDFTGWPEGPENSHYESDVFYQQKVDAGKAAYTKGVQIIRPSRPKHRIFESIQNPSTGGGRNQYVEFVAQDWRNARIAKISTDPSATVPYFRAGESRLPFEVSPAFFRPDVLQKYKADQDKYTVDEENRTIRCRNIWELRGYDVNEAGQVHTYLCYLRELPYQEQLYWQSFNEKPKANISIRAFTNDFEGEFYDLDAPLLSVLSTIRSWSESELDWWQLVDDSLLERVSVPRAESRNEWSDAFLDLAKLVIEGFRVRPLRKVLRNLDIQFGDEGSLALLEKVLNGHNALKDGDRLEGLRTVQYLRTKGNAHVSGGESLDLAKSALELHGTFAEHFERVCGDVARELNLIEDVLRPSDS